MTDPGATFIAGLPLATVVAAALASLLCGLVGTFVVLRRLVALGGGVAHASFGGIGVAVVLGLDPRLGAAAVATGAALVLAAMPRERSDRRDAVIGVLWSVGMAVGILLLSRRGSGEVDVESYLFGDIERVRASDLVLLAALAALVSLAHVARGRELVATAFDPEQAQLQGLPVRALDTLQLLLATLSVVALLELAGVVLAIALLAIPPLVALRLFRSLSAIIGGAIALAFVILLAGLELGVRLAWPAGPAVVSVGALALGVAHLVPRRGR
ncbi:MAG: metal ABC transporter permease [Thermoanaerobaculia bacterium]